MRFPIIFLDFDGVLNNPGCYAIASGSHAPPDPKCVEALNRITKETGARLVVSSSWRIIFPLIELRELLIDWRVTGPVIGTTPHLGTPRGQEISKWLLDHERTRLYPDAFVVIDDDQDAEPFLDHLIQTDGSIGLTMQDAERAIRLLQSANVSKPQATNQSGGERQQNSAFESGTKFRYPD